jgi:HD superfamily phosphodiesterase
MKAVFEKILELAKPYLDTRKNEIHTEISIRFAFQLLEGEGGDEDTVIPATILHDVGWKRIPEDLQPKAFGPKAACPELNRIHETEGVKIAREILGQVGYDRDKTEEILEIIDGHDSRRQAISLNDKLVKDADKLWRFSKEGLHIDLERFGQTRAEGLERIRSDLKKCFFTDSAREMARKELEKRIQEANDIRNHA